MTKKKQSKRSAKQGGKKSSSRSGVAPTLHEIPAVKPAQPPADTTVDAKILSEPAHVDAPIDAHALSAPEPIHPEPVPTDIAAEPTLHTSIAAAVTEEVSAPQPTSTNGSISTQAAVPPPTAPESHAVAHSASANNTSSDTPSVSTSITNDIPMPSTLSSPAVEQNQDQAGATASPAPDQTSSTTTVTAQAVTPSSAQQPSQVQKTKYDIEAMKNAAPGIALTAHGLKLQSLGSLTRSKSRSEVARGLSSGNDEGYTWRPPIDYFGASASAFSSSFSGSESDLNARENPGDFQSRSAASPSPDPVTPHSQTAPAPPHTPTTTPQSTAPQYPMSPANPAAPYANAPGPGPAQIKPLPFSAATPFGTAPLPAPAPLPLPVPPSPAVPGSPPVPPVGPAPPQIQPAAMPAPAVPGAAAPKVYESTTDANALSPKMAKFIESLRERELTKAGATAPTVPAAETSVDMNAMPQQQAATSVDVNAVPQQAATSVDINTAAQAQTAPAKVEATPPFKSPETKPADQTLRDLAPLAKENDGEAQPSKPGNDGTPLAPKSSSQVTELRESIISQKADGKSDDWHPIGEKKAPRKADPQFSAELDDFKKTDTIRHKSESERHLTLEEMAAMDPELALAPQTPQQQSIRRLKNAGGIHAEIYIPIYLVCIGLSWVTEQSAAAGTFRDAGQRVESSLQLIAPKTLAENFRAGVDAFDDRDIKLHPFNPNKPRSIVSLLISRIQAFCSGLSSAFSRIPGTIASSTANNPLALVMVFLSYLSVFSLALIIYFKFKRSTSWIIADFILLPIGLVAASTVITAVLISILSMSVSLGAGYVSNTIVLYTTLAVVLCVSDMARRTFLRRKKQ